MDELPINDIPSQAVTLPVTFTPFGTPIATTEIQERVSQNLYPALADSSNAETADATVQRAITRAEIYIGAILYGLHVPLNLDSQIIREIIKMQTLYELHMALGHEEAGREFRMLAKNAIIAAFGSFPDADNPMPEKAPAAVVVQPKRHSEVRTPWTR
jgi:hypothetical protein